MIGIISFMDKLCGKIASKSTVPIQVINRKYIQAIPEDQLTVPRCIVDLSGVVDSKFYYNENKDLGTELESSITRVSTIEIDLYFVSNEHDETAYEALESIRAFYNNPYTIKFDDINSCVKEVSDIDDMNIYRYFNTKDIYKLKIKFDVDNVDKTTIDFATSVNGTIYNKNEDGTVSEMPIQ